MKTSVEEVIADIIRREGGYVNHPNDKGGPTKYGITLANFKRWSGGDLQALKALTVEEAFAFYIWYFEERNLMGYPPELFEQIMDMNTLHSPGGVSTILDDVAAYYKPYGERWNTKQVLQTMVDEFGPITTNALLSLRRRHYVEDYAERNKKQRVFLRGWANRFREFEPKW